MRTLEVNGEIFEVTTPKNSNVQRYVDLLTAIPRNIRECYVRPSVYKVEIYEYWKEWFHSLSQYDDVTFKQFNGVTSYNGFQFTIGGLLEVGQREYIVVITKAHNRLIEVVS